MRILLVEDDDLLRETLHEWLVKSRYAVDAVADSSTASEYLALYRYDLMILDILLPGRDGISFCQELRSQGHSLPVLLLSARDTSPNKIAGLDAGADDFVSKPFDIDELEARIRALLRRGETESTPVLQWGQLELDPGRVEVTYGGQPIALTPKEYALMELFLRNGYQAIDYDKIMDSLWPAGEYPGRETIRTHIKELRQKLQAAGVPADTIATVRGKGYQLRALTEAVPIAEGDRTSATAAANSESLQRAEFLTAQSELWEQFRPKRLERLDVIEAASRELDAQTLDRRLQERAAREAHTLAGTAGTFGFDEAARLALQLEALLRAEEKDDRPPAQLVSTLVEALRSELDETPSESRFQDDMPAILVAGREPESMQQLVQLARAAGLHAETASTPAEIRQAIAQHIPTIVTIEVPLLREVEDAEAIAVLTRQTPPVPVIALGESDRLDERLEVTRLGASTFLKAPARPETVLEVVRQELERSGAGAKVMVVDDDPQLLQRVAALLEPWGFKLSLLEDSRQFWIALEAVRPDVVVLDVVMPHVDGIELCQVLRSDPDWSRLPIVCLSARAEPEIQEQASAAGADDYVRKPVVAAELAHRILNRLHRAQS